MVCSPVFGYMGDRYTRKIIMACGITFWAGVTLAGSFIPADVSVLVFFHANLNLVNLS
jgi:MFS family permease